MTSKNYLCKSIKENVRRNMFLTIWISLALTIISLIDYVAKNIQVLTNGGM